MRAIKTSVISILAIGLLAGSAVGVAAQDDPIETSFLNGTLTVSEAVAPGTETRDGGVTEVRNRFFAGGLLDTDDPRMMGPITAVVNSDVRIEAGTNFRVTLQSIAVRIENDDGAWDGSATAFARGRSPRDTGNLATVILAGEGSYDGLSAYLLIDLTEQPAVVQGTVYAGTMTPSPDPVGCTLPHTGREPWHGLCGNDDSLSDPVPTE